MSNAYEPSNSYLKAKANELQRGKRTIVILDCFAPQFTKILLQRNLHENKDYIRIAHSMKCDFGRRYRVEEWEYELL